MSAARTSGSHRQRWKLDNTMPSSFTQMLGMYRSIRTMQNFDSALVSSNGVPEISIEQRRDILQHVFHWWTINHTINETSSHHPEFCVSLVKDKPVCVSYFVFCDTKPLLLVECADDSDANGHGGNECARYEHNQFDGELAICEQRRELQALGMDRLFAGDKQFHHIADFARRHESFGDECLRLLRGRTRHEWRLVNELAAGLLGCG